MALDKKAIDRDRWFNLVTGKDLEAIIEHFETRKKILLAENMELANQKSGLDDSIQQGHNNARIVEINTFINKVNYYRNEISKGE